MNNTIPSSTADVLIIGAGISGLMAAAALQEQGFRCLVLDKGRSVGGRLATRRIGPGRADHGAQFFTVRTGMFGDWAERWRKAGLLFEWSRGWSDGSLRPSLDIGHPRLAVRGGMNALAKYLAQGFDAHRVEIQTDVRVTALRVQEQGWEAEDAAGSRYQAQAVVLTPPVPQSLALLDAGHAVLNEGDRAALARIRYAPCLAGMFWVEGEIDLPEPGVLQRPGHNISWIADNQRKGISPDAKLITVQAGPAYSNELWAHSADEALTMLQAEVYSLLAPRARMKEAQLKRWRYALPTVIHPETHLHAANLPPLVFAGDAFDGPRVEGAARSGLKAGEYLAGRLGKVGLRK